jgi:hypothetical protein
MINAESDIVGIFDDLLEPIPSPVVGEVYHYSNTFFGLEFDFEIINERKEHYDILINGEQSDVLKKDYDLLELSNTGIIEKIGENNVADYERNAE